MCGPSIILSNKNNFLPPLLLPSLGSNQKMKKLKIDTSNLDKLAAIAIKNIDFNLNDYNTNNNNYSYVQSRSHSHSYDGKIIKLNQRKKISIPSPSPSPSPSAPLSPLNYKSSQESEGENEHDHEHGNIATSNSKLLARRQRIGPSCDNCRSKKIKCNASIEILYQNDIILNLFSEKLHHSLSIQDINDFLMIQDNSDLIDLQNFLHQFAQSELSENKTQLIKHLDKLILFKPCSQCNNKKNGNKKNSTNKKQKQEHINYHHCTFSKGFTRADISIFNKIIKKISNNDKDLMSKKSIFELTINDL